MLVNLPANIISALQSSNSPTINSFITSELAKYAPKGIITDAMVPSVTTGITLTINRVAATPLTAQITVALAGIADNTLKAEAEAAVTAAITAGLSPLRVWSGEGMKPSEVIDFFDTTLLARIKTNNITVTFNAQLIDPEISFGAA